VPVGYGLIQGRIEGEPTEGSEALLWLLVSSATHAFHVIGNFSIMNITYRRMSE
jgi:hypothetical protein